MNRERKALAARLEILINDLRTGRSTQAEVDECQKAYDVLVKNGNKTEISAVAHVPTSSIPTRAYKQDNVPTQLDESTRIILEDLTNRQNEVGTRKDAACNALGNFGDHINTKTQQDEILQLREEWKALGDKKRFVLEHGKLPEETKPDLPEGWADKLPRDKFKLDRDIKNLKINLKKWNDKLDVCKDLGDIQNLKVKIIQGEIKLDVMDKIFKSL